MTYKCRVKADSGLTAVNRLKHSLCCSSVKASVCLSFEEKQAVSNKGLA